MGDRVTSTTNSSSLKGWLCACYVRHTLIVAGERDLCSRELTVPWKLQIKPLASRVLPRQRLPAAAVETSLLV